jgi:hypothetical protein
MGITDLNGPGDFLSFHGRIPDKSESQGWRKFSPDVDRPFGKARRSTSPSEKNDVELEAAASPFFASSTLGFLRNPRSPAAKLLSQLLRHY